MTRSRGEEVEEKLDRTGGEAPLMNALLISIHWKEIDVAPRILFGSIPFLFSSFFETKLDNLFLVASDDLI